GTLERVPKLAKAHGLGVIMGVRDASDEAEVNRAIAQRAHVDAYCLGHNGLNRLYTLPALEAAVERVRRRTQRPVGTSEEGRFYRDNKRFRTVGDWIYPSLSLYFGNQRLLRPSDVDPYVMRCIDQAQVVSRVSVQDDRPLMLNSLTFPWSGVP